MTLRRIQPMDFPDTEAAVVGGDHPRLEWVKPESLLIDGAYQRDLRPTSVSLIRKIYREFAWSRIKPPISVRVDGGYHVIDGQHTAIAAASLQLPLMPIFVVKAEDVAERAKSFEAHNRNRVTITPLDIFHAQVTYGDPLAVTVSKTCKEVGVRMRYMTHGMKREVGDTQCISLVRKLFARHGTAHARAVLSMLVAAKCAPISEPQLLAASKLLLEGADAARLKMAVRVDVDGDTRKARSKAALDDARIDVALASIWKKRMGGA